ncbi:hypothetical protein BDV93DRAFT_84288 [Ceratobasidium sp. AG-I]|nr:hypothetical protein BDV93DRAFT_84288 [Ceratobasidium sp. AG-I]
MHRKCSLGFEGLVLGIFASGLSKSTKARYPTTHHRSPTPLSLSIHVDPNAFQLCCRSIFHYHLLYSHMQPDIGISRSTYNCCY